MNSPFQRAAASHLKLLLVLALLVGGCTPKYEPPHPTLACPLMLSRFGALPSPFPPLTDSECTEDWSKEYRIGTAFAAEGDLYRAITAYKRALILLTTSPERKQQIEYDIVLAYYLGGKQKEALNFFENSSLTAVTTTFPAFDELTLLLYDLYRNTHAPCAAEQLLETIRSRNAERERTLRTYDALKKGEMESLDLNETPLHLRKELACCAGSYALEKKSVTRARTLNALLPGAGYYYVGQKQTALTSFLLNTLFIAATYQCLHHNQIAAGALLGSLEFGWYFGGIHGAGLAAQEYNQRLYETKTLPLLCKEKVFPILMFQRGF